MPRAGESGRYGDGTWTNTKGFFCFFRLGCSNGENILSSDPRASQNYSNLILSDLGSCNHQTVDGVCDKLLLLSVTGGRPLS